MTYTTRDPKSSTRCRLPPEGRRSVRSRVSTEWCHVAKTEVLSLRGFNGFEMRVLVVKLSSIGDIVHCLPAVAAIKAPVIEVHISNVHAREEFRRHSFVSPKAAGTICGLGLEGYALALQWLMQRR